MLHITWEDGTEHSVDLSALLIAEDAFQPLCDDDAAFRSVTAGNGGAVWPGGLTVPAEELWTRGLNQDAARLRAWRQKRGLSVEGFAEGIGLAVADVRRYEEAEVPIPKIVKLAMIGFELMRRREQP